MSRICSRGKEGIVAQDCRVGKQEKSPLKNNMALIHEAPECAGSWVETWRKPCLVLECLRRAQEQDACSSPDGLGFRRFQLVPAPCMCCSAAKGSR